MSEIHNESYSFYIKKLKSSVLVTKDSVSMIQLLSHTNEKTTSQRKYTKNRYRKTAYLILT